MPACVKTEKDEKLWSEARELADKQGQDENWAYVMKIFQSLKGSSNENRFSRIAHRVVNAWFYNKQPSYGDYQYEALSLLQDIEAHVVRYHEKANLPWGKEEEVWKKSLADLHEVKKLMK